MTDAIIFDVDGTLANIDHRLHYIKHGNKDWDAFYEAMVDDQPNLDVCLLADLLSDHPWVELGTIKFFVCSGRPEDYRKQTEKWLGQQVPGLMCHQPEVLMRPSGDYRPDTAIKREMLTYIRSQGYDVRLVVDDRQRVVDMWRAEGITVLQCAQWSEKTGDYAAKPGVLHVLVGPSGSGKSTYAKRNWHYCHPGIIISSDDLREQMTGDHRDMSQDRQMWTLLHTMVEARIKAGMSTVVDATNIKTRNRKEIVALAPEDAEVFYHVIDRPMDEKVRDAGWRADVEVKGKSLIEYHDEVFRNNLGDILAGDNLPNVQVIDHRQQLMRVE